MAIENQFQRKINSIQNSVIALKTKLTTYFSDYDIDPMTLLIVLTETSLNSDFKDLVSDSHISSLEDYLEFLSKMKVAAYQNILARLED